MLAGVRDVFEELRRITHIKGDHVARRQHHRVSVNRKRRCGDDRRVARPHQREAHVAERLFRPEARDDFIVAVQLHAVLAVVPFGDLFAQAGDAVGDRIPVVLRLQQSLLHLVGDLLIGSIRRVAHAQVNHVHTGDALLVLQLVDFAKQIRRQPLQPIRDGDRKGIVGQWNFGFVAHERVSSVSQ